MRTVTRRIACLFVLLFAGGAPGAAWAQEAVTVQAVTGAEGRLRFQTTLDKKFVSKVYTLRNAKAAEVQPLIEAVVGTEDGNVSPLSIEGAELLVVSAPTYMIPALDDTVAALDRADATVDADGTDDVFYRPRHRLPTELAGLAAEAGASSLATAVADDVNNLIYFSDTPESLKAITGALEAFDVPQAQAEIEVKVVEISEADNKRIGLLWDAWKKAFPQSVEVSNSRERTRSDADGEAKTTTWSVDFSLISPQALADFVNFMAHHGAAEVKTTTRLNCVQGTAARVVAGDVHRFTTAAQAREDAPAVSLVDTVVDGLVLDLTPFIGTESIRLRIGTEVNSMSGFDPNGLPVVNSRAVSATAVLKDGQVFALTGLERQTIVHTEHRVWLLGSIPLVGDWLFTTHDTARPKSQLIVILTPRLLALGDTGVRGPEGVMP